MKVEFEMLGKTLAKELKTGGVEEAQLFQGSGTDLYIGFSTMGALRACKDAMEFGGITQVFTPQKGSDMDHYRYGLDVPFGLMDYKIRNKASWVSPK